MSEYTRGPWTVRYTLGPSGRTDLLGPCVIETEGRVRLATMEGWRNDLQVANANLVASAPDLLEALEEATMALEIAGVWLLTKKYWDIIKKARGER